MRPMRVFLDGRAFQVPSARGGIGRYLTRTANALLRNGALRLVVGIGDRADAALPAFADAGLAGRVEWMRTPAFNRMEGYVAYDDAELRALRDSGADLLWIPNPLTLETGFPAAALPCPVVATIHDLIPLALHESYYDYWPPELRRLYDARLAWLHTQAAVCVFPSDSAREDYRRFVPGVRAAGAGPLLAVVPHGVEPGFFGPRPPAEEVGTPYVLMVGHSEERKGIARGILAFAALMRRGGLPAGVRRLRVVCGGDLEPLRRLVAGTGLSDAVELIGCIDDARLAALYRGATLLFFPSAYEGFGLPVLEALAGGTPVLTAPTSSLKAFDCPGGVFFIHSFAPDRLADALAETLARLERDGVDRARLVRYAAGFTWADAAERHVRAFAVALSGRAAMAAAPGRAAAAR